MKPLLARIAFGASAVLFGAIALLWHDAQTWQTLRALWSLPLGTWLGAALMVAQIAGGIALIVPASARVGACCLTIVYGAFSLVCLTVLIAQPASYDSFFEQLSLLCGAFSVYLVTSTLSNRAWLILATRIGFALSAISFTVTQALFLHETAALVPKWIPPNQLFWAVLTTIAFGLAAAAILTGVRARLALQLTALMTGLFGLLVWVPIVIARPDAHLAWSELAITFLIAGSSFVLGSMSIW